MKQTFVIEHNCKTKFGISTEFLAEAICEYSFHKIKATVTEITETEPERCKWTPADQFDDEIWETGCGEEFIFTAEGPKENGVKFCHNCGKPIEISE